MFFLHIFVKLIFKNLSIIFLTDIKYINTTQWTGWRHEERAETLPWRKLDPETSRLNPYYVLISEFMLQQTTITTVIPSFLRWIDQWPTYILCKGATLEEFNLQWQGLGYYSRVQNLYKTIQQLPDDTHQWPDSATLWTSFPGIGPYTSAALSSLINNEPILALDGNTIRVLCRFFGLENYTKIAAVKYLQEKIKISQEAIDLYQPYRRLTENLIDIGSTLCKPLNPKCELCPMRMQCHGSADFSKYNVDKRKLF